MTTPNDKPNELRTIQAVFSVCASPEVNAAAMLATDNVIGAEFAGEFQEYITAERRPQFSPVINTAPGCVALVDCDRDPDLAVQTMQRLQQALPGRINFIALASNMDAKLLLNVMRAGCSEFLTKPLDSDELAAALTRFQAGQTTVQQPGRDLGRVITMYGVKGGVGSTTLAVYLATFLTKVHRKRVLLIDHRSELGHVALYLGIKESLYYFEGLVRNVDRIDAEFLEGFVVRHASGLEVVPSPDVCSHVPESSPADIERVLMNLRRFYDFILVDSSLQYRSTLTPMISASDEVCLVCTPDIASLRDLTRQIEHLSLIDGFGSRVKVIVNRATSDDAVSPESIAKLVRFPVSYSVPNNYMALLHALNAGEPISPQTKSPFAATMNAWANRLVGAAAAQASKPAEKEKKKSFAFWR